MGKRYVPGFRGRVFVDEVGRRVDVRFNSQGFRGPEWPEQGPGKELRLAVLGDSMTAAIATDEERTFVRRLETALESGGAGPVVAMNFGVSSASTGSELVTWRRVAARYRPDLVLLAFFSGNDFSDNSPRLTRAPRVYFELDGAGRLVPGPDPEPTPALTRWLDGNSRLYVWQKTAFRKLRATAQRAARGIEPGQLIFARGGDPDVEHAWRLTAALMLRLRDEAEAAGARFAVVVIPCAEQVDDALWEDLARRAREADLVLDRDQPSRRLAAICTGAAIPLADLTPAFTAAARRSPGNPSSAEGLYLLGRFHLSEQGHRLTAEVLHRFLRDTEGGKLLEPR